MSANIIDGTLQLCGGPLIPAHITIKYDMLPSDDNLTSSNNKTKQNDLVFDEHDIERDDDYHLILLTAKCVS